MKIVIGQMYCWLTDRGPRDILAKDVREGEVVLVDAITSAPVGKTKVENINRAMARGILVPVLLH